MTMNKGERTELKAIVKQQFSVLKAELDQRQAELTADAEAAIVARYDERDRLRLSVEQHVIAAVDEAQAKINLLLEQHPDDLETMNRFGGAPEPIQLRYPPIQWNDQDKVQRHRAMVAAIEADVAGAKLRLKRQEADLLRQLSVDALEGDAAKAFLDAIPSVGELVPAARLAELEASLDEESPG